MSTYFMNYVLRICDRLFDRNSAESIDRQGQLNQVVVVVLIFHLIMGISFVKMEEYEKKHPRVIRDVDISFLCSAPPPAAEFRVGELDLVPKSIVLTPGQSADLGAEAKQEARAEKLSVSTPKAEEKDIPLSSDPVQTRRSDQFQEAPVSITSMSPVKAEPLSQSKSHKFTDAKTDLVGSSSSTPASGATQRGGSTFSNSDEDGTGGHGPGGLGKGVGEFGAGVNGDGHVGGEKIEKISMVLDSTAATGNIKPYKLRLQKIIAERWRPKSGVSLTVSLVIDKEGNFVSCDVYSGSGNKKVDREAIEVIEGLEFEPLPEWYTGRELSFRLDLNGL